jgi:uncharacterized protein with HEPN domain
MSTQSFTPKDFMEHMLDAAGQIQIYMHGKSINDFFKDRLLQDAVIRNFEIIGEAARRLMLAEPDIQTKFPEIPFAAIYGMRNQLAHAYFAIEYNVVVTVIEQDIPKLISELKLAIQQLSGSA